MNHATTRSPGKKIILLIVVVLLLGFVFSLFHRSASAPELKTTPQKQSTKEFNKHLFSTTQPGSLWLVVNKQHPLDPKTYKPTTTVPNVTLKHGKTSENMHVSTAMAPALTTMFDAASQAGYPLMLSSGYRSYDYQVAVYNSIVRAKGEAQADKESARPGYSEHQTGLAADIAPSSGKCDLSQCFGDTPEGRWVAANAYKYGFIVRYPLGKESVTGYEYEPWHVRYVGTDLATEMHSKHIETLEEFFNISGGTSFN